MKTQEIEAAFRVLFDDSSNEKQRGEAVARLALAHFETQERIATALEKIAAHSYPPLRT